MLLIRPRKEPKFAGPLAQCVSDNGQTSHQPNTSHQPITHQPIISTHQPINPHPSSLILDMILCIYVFRTPVSPRPGGAGGVSYPLVKVCTLTLLGFCIAQNHFEMCIWPLRSAPILGNRALGFVLRFGFGFLALSGSSWGRFGDSWGSFGPSGIIFEPLGDHFWVAEVVLGPL